MRRFLFPFSGLIGQEKMKTGLILNAVDPTIGGVLISGHKGTGKSTAVRALAGILPALQVVQGCPYHCSPADDDGLCPACSDKRGAGETLATETRPMPLVELPLSATEDRVVGTLHIEQTLKTGERSFEPGLLAAANRGILYVDEVNLLDDHLVDILLDAAASGVNVVEREGVSFSHPARFMLVGTMNPEEGELRPQFLDRFGLSLTVGGLTDPNQRRLVVARRIAFDRDPEAFVAQGGGDDALVSEQIVTARARLDQIRLPDRMLGLAVSLAAAVKAQGHRADIAIVKAARALAALMEEAEVRPMHVLEAGRFVLPHRITTVPLATAAQLEETLEEIFRRVCAGDEPEEKAVTPPEAEPDAWEDISTQVPGATAASNVDMLFTFLEEKKKRFSTPMN